MRPDTISVYADGDLICFTCWEWFRENMETSTKEPWPEDDLPVFNKATKAMKYDGVLVDKKTRERVGVVKSYNPATRTASKVTLDEYPDLGEPGIIDEAHDVEPVGAAMSIKVKENKDDEGSESDDD
jgi:hypothetical protein